MTTIAGRLRDILLALKKQFGMASDLDRLIPYVAFEKDLTRDQLNNLFVTYPARVPEDYRSALVIEIQKTIRRYWHYCQSKPTPTSRAKIKASIIFLEEVVRRGFEGCILTPDKVVGFRLELKSK